MYERSFYFDKCNKVAEKTILTLKKARERELKINLPKC